MNTILKNIIQSKLFRFIFDRSIRIKFAVIISLLIAMISLIIYLYFPARIETQAMESLRDKAYSITEMAAFSITAALDFDDKEAALEILQGVKQNRDILFVIVYNKNNDVFVSYYQGNKSAYSNLLLDSKVTKSTQTGLIYKTSMPIIQADRRIGNIAIGISLENVNRQIKDSREGITFFSVAIFLIGIFAVLATGTIITTPLKRIVRTVEAVADGNMEKRVREVSRDEVGQLAKSFNIMIDNLEKAQADLRNVNIRLEKRVKERTKELLQKNEDLEKLSRLKSDMVSITSHDLKAPLSSIIGYADILLNSNSRILEKEEKDHLQRILNNGYRMNNFISEILDLEKIESGRFELNPVLSDFSELLHSCVEINSVTAKKRSITISVHIEGKPRPIIVDEMKMEQMLNNILSNAVKFSPEKSEINVLYKHDKDRTAQISICDQGPGIPKKDLESIFDRYYQTDTVDKDKQRSSGIGLGLYISREIVNLHSGKIRAANRKDGGICFHIEIPIEDN